jgi:putative endonuclease
MARHPVVYILASRSRALYVGVTAYLDARLEQHKSGRGFAGRSRTWRLVYAEPHDRITDAIAREKQLKGWRRAKKVALVERENPQWRDLSWARGRRRWPGHRSGSARRRPDVRRDPSTGSG